jgi:sigma-B regulation protein RsbU (phosphoserine phosphatase)
LILYSDGITECSDPGGEAFGYERFRETLARASQALGGGSLAAVLEQRLREWRGPFDFEDDISMLALERPLGEPEDSATNSL